MGAAKRARSPQNINITPAELSRTRALRNAENRDESRRHAENQQRKILEIKTRKFAKENMPKAYRKCLREIKKAERKGLTGTQVNLDRFDGDGRGWPSEEKYWSWNAVINLLRERFEKRGYKAFNRTHVSEGVPCETGDSTWVAISIHW